MIEETTPSQFPADFLDRMQLLYGSQAESILSVLTEGRPTTLRANTLKTTTEEVYQQLTSAGFELERVEWLSAFVLRNKSIRELEEHPLYVNGAIYIQGLSSMIPPLVLAPQAGESVLDIAAAPGSKTTQIAALMENDGMILANDTSTVRLYKLQANLTKLGVTCVKVQRGLGEIVWKRFNQVFDRALADVPCSMEGRFNLSKPKTYQNWSVKKIKELAQRQKNLLRSAVSATLPGGTIVYSTCTLSPEENEAVVDWLLKKEQGRVVLEAINMPDGLASPAVLSWQGKEFDPQVSLTKRIIPTSLYEGFFIAQFKKLVSTVD